MTDKMFVDVHVIQSIPPSCVNRDDTGSPKTCVYGGVRRARISSQSWKKAIRKMFSEEFDESDLGLRTKKIVELIAKRIVEIDPSVSEADAAEKAVKVLAAAGVTVKAPKKKSEGVTYDEAKALFFISTKQVDNLARLAIGGEYDKKTAQAALNKDKGIEIALFGRMVADDPTLNADATVQVAHAISTHKVDNEYDYYTAVDDKAPEDNAGAGMIGTIEYNSSTVYRYATVAVHALRDQLNGDSEATAMATEAFVKAFVLSMPDGKRNTFANGTLPTAVLICVRRDQPLSLADAFESPVTMDVNGGFEKKSVKRLVDREKEACSDFVEPPVKTLQIGRGLEDLGPSMPLSEAVSEVGRLVRGE